MFRHHLGGLGSTTAKRNMEDLTPSLTLGDVLGRTVDHLTARGCPSPRVDAEHLLGHVLDLRRIELYMHFDRPLTALELERARVLVSRRADREPLQHVLGEWGFRRLTLSVDSRALVPRPETEIVVERCLALLAGCEAPRVLDVGVGSGAIALAIADEHPGALVTGLDISPDALALAAENSSRTGLPVELETGDLRHGLPEGPWDMVVSNPPYVDPDDRDGLQPEVRSWEPETALYGVGLHAEVARHAADVLVEGGWIVLEVGDEQAGDVAVELAALGYGEVRSSRDLTGTLRVVEGRR